MPLTHAETGASPVGPIFVFALVCGCAATTNKSSIDALNDSTCSGVQSVLLRSIAAGSQHLCVLDEGGSVFCTGDNTLSQLGFVGESSFDAWHRIELSGPAREIRAGSGFTCALLEKSRQLECWGSNSSGELNTAPNIPKIASARTIEFPREDANKRIVAFDLGAEHACASLESGALYCWGNNNQRQVDPYSKRTILLAVEPQWHERSKPMTLIATGHDFTCSLQSDGVPHCWGNNSDAQLGRDPGIDTGQPAYVQLKDRRLKTLVAGDRHACGLTPDSRILCWGSNRSFQLGIGTTTDDTKAQPQVDAPISVRAGGLDRMGTTCALLKSGQVHCWGARSADGRTLNTTQPLPFEIKKLTSKSATKITLSERFSCALLQGNTLNCWEYPKEHPPTTLTTTITAPCPEPPQGREYGLGFFFSGEAQPQIANLDFTPFAASVGVEGDLSEDIFWQAQLGYAHGEDQVRSHNAGRATGTIAFRLFPIGPLTVGLSAEAGGLYAGQNSNALSIEHGPAVELAGATFLAIPLAEALRLRLSAAAALLFYQSRSSQGSKHVESDLFWPIGIELVIRP